jgi:NAD(P)H-hydrate epimerase
MATRSNDFSFSSLPYPTVDLSDLPVVDQAMMVEIDRVMEHDLGIALIQMMENAGRCLARLARSALPDPGSPVLVMAGRGGNGGGGLTAARRLAGWGHTVEVVISAPPHRFDGVPAHQLKTLQAMGIPVSEALPQSADRYVLVIDALVGYALSGTARGWLADAIAMVNARTATQCLSLDVPSGFDSQLGRPTGVTIRPDAILTIAAPKAGLIESFSSCPVFLADISVPASVFAKSTGKSFAPPADISRIVSGNSGA